MICSLTDTCRAIGKVIQKPQIQISFVSYLLQGQDTILIDTVPPKAASQWFSELISLTDCRQIDALILNHSEEDHSGGLSLLLSCNPSLPIYCTPACRDRLKPDYPDAHFICVADRSDLEIGTFRFHFIHTPGLHWDDNMVTFYENEHLLFSNDLFGQYIGHESLSDDKIPADQLMGQTKTYFEKVFGQATAAQKQVFKDIRELPVHRIAPGHGVVLQTQLQPVMDLYLSYM